MLISIYENLLIRDNNFAMIVQYFRNFLLKFCHASKSLLSIIVCHLSDCNFSLAIARQIWELVEDREAPFPMAAPSLLLLLQLRLQTVGLHSECLRRAVILILVNIRLDSNQSLFRMMKWKIWETSISYRSTSLRNIFLLS